MGQVTFEQATETMSATTNNSRNNVSFFSLKNDGDEAIVRFMHDNTASFDIVAIHPNISVDGKMRKVNCIRDAREPLDKCPLCNSGAKIENKFFIHLIQYVRDESGNIIPTAKVWERSLVYANQLATLINEYGPLSDCIFKIRRCGVAGSKDTTYQIMYASPQVYKPELYPKKEDLFEGFKVIGSIVMDKTFDELSSFVATGSFPSKTNEGVVSYSSQNSVPNFVPPTEAPAFGGNITAPWEASTPINRPVRTY